MTLLPFSRTPLLLAVAAVAFAAAPASAQDVFINEFHYDDAGADAGEFVEIAGPAGTDLTGWTVELYNGSNGDLYGTIGLTGTIDDEGAGFGALSFDQSGIQNGSPDGLALIDGGGAVVQFLSYEGSFTADADNGGVAGAAGATSTDVGVAEAGSEPDGQSLQLTGTGSQYGDFSWSGPSDASPGSVNAGQTFEAPAGGTTLSEGDLAIIAVDPYLGGDGNNDQFSFVLLTDVAAGTEIRFSDYDYSSGTDSFSDSGSDGEILVTLQALPAGTVVTVNVGATVALADGTQGTATVSEGGFGLSQWSGDTVLAFQGAGFVSGSANPVGSRDDDLLFFIDAGHGPTTSAPSVLGADAFTSFTNRTVVYDARPEGADAPTSGTVDALIDAFNELLNYVSLNGDVDPEDYLPASFDVISDAPMVSLVLSSESVSEDGGTITLRAILSGPADGDATISIEPNLFDDDRARFGVDYTVSDDVPGTPGLQILVPSGAMEGAVTITGVPDGLLEDDEYASLFVSSVSGNVQDPECEGGEIDLRTSMAKDDRTGLDADLAMGLGGGGCAVYFTVVNVGGEAPDGDNGTPSDAGNLLDAPPLAVTDDGTSFFGFLGNGPEAEPEDDVDCYAFDIVDPAAFGAELFRGNDAPLGDSQFHLFTAAGEFILSDDDGGDGLNSRIYPGEFSGDPGAHVLCVTSFNNDPSRDEGGFLTGWSSGYSFGDYRVELTGTSAPEGGGTVRFAQVQQVVSEGAGEAVLLLETEGVAGPTPVTVTLVSGDPADLGGFTSTTVTVGGVGSPDPFEVPIPVTDDFLPEENETFIFQLSSPVASIDGGLFSLVVVDNDGDPVTVTVPTGDGGLRVLSLPVNGVTAGDVAAAAGADGVLVFDAGAGAFVPAGPATPLMAGQPVLVDVDPGADLTFTGSAPTGPTAFAQTTVEADGAARVLVPVGNPSGEPLSLSALTVEGGALADVALVFDPTSGAFVPVSLAALGCCDAASPYLYPYAVVVLQVTPDGDPAGVRVTVGEDAPGGSGESVTEAAFEPTDGESAVVLEVRPAGADGATRLAAEALVAEAPGDVLVLRLGVGGDGLDPFDGFDVVSPPGATLATPGPEGSDALYAALSWPAPGVGETLAMPLYLRVPEPGAYEMVLAGTPSEVDGRPVVVTLFDGTTSTELGAGEPFAFTVAEGDSVLAGRFSVELSVGAGVAAEADPAAPSVSVYPNPAAGRATVALAAVTGDVRVSVFDALGREVAVLHDGPVAGSLEASVAPGRLRPGAYLVRVVGEGLTATRALTVVR